MTDMTAPNTPPQKPARPSNWIPWLFIAFFAVVFAVNGVMIALATDSFTGLVTEQPYEKGVALALTQSRARAPLTGEGEIRLAPEGRELSVALDLSPPEGERLTDPTAWVVMELPSRYAQVLRLDLTQIGPAAFEGARTLPQGGTWTVTLMARDGEREFRAVQTLEVE